MFVVIRDKDTLAEIERVEFHLMEPERRAGQLEAIRRGAVRHQSDFTNSVVDLTEIEQACGVKPS